MSDVSLNDVTKLLVGLKWDPNQDAEGDRRAADEAYNMDLSCALFGEGLSFIDIITPQIPSREKYGKQIFHAGDHVSGGSDFEDETLNITFDALDNEIKYIAIIVSCVGGVKFSKVGNASCDFLVYESLEELASVDLTNGKMAHMLVGVIRKDHTGDWKVQQLSADLACTGTAELTKILQDRL